MSLKQLMCIFLINEVWTFFQSLHAKASLDKTSFIFSVKCKLGLRWVQLMWNLNPVYWTMDYSVKQDTGVNTGI